MKRIIACVTFILVSVAICFPQSLGEMARKEKERREKTRVDRKVITNDDTSRYKNGAITTGTPQAAGPDKTQQEKQTSPQPAASDESVDFEGRPESYWRQTFADARKRVQDLENEANVLVLKIADLQTAFYREADGFRQQTIQRDIQKAFYEQDLNKENLAKARDLLQDLEKEARKSGALPGWIAPRK